LIAKDDPSNMREPRITGGVGINSLNALSTIKPSALRENYPQKEEAKISKNGIPGTKESTMALTAI